MKTLLAIIEQGGYPDFTAFYKSLGYNVTTARSMRKALGLLKQLRPDVITAEFIYSPMYSARISNLESLFACLQNQDLNPRLIVFTEKETHHHMARLDTGRFDIQALSQPLSKAMLEDCLNPDTIPG